MNAAEKLVYNLCNNSFFILWSYPNPRRKRSYKELCDILVVCSVNVIIISVKEIEVKGSGNYSVDSERWYREAIKRSVRQIYGAERQLIDMNEVFTSEGYKAISLPDINSRKIFRIAVALGSEGRFGIPSGDFGKGFVHVFDENSLRIVMNELDTIVDFTRYLEEKEKAISRNKKVMSSEEDLLAYYLLSGYGYDFPDKCNVVIEEGIWRNLKRKREYKKLKKLNRISYVWDNLIQQLVRDYLTGHWDTTNTLQEVEQALRMMVLEDRFSRRYLGVSGDSNESANQHCNQSNHYSLLLRFRLIRR